jgi:hypothetical protein
MLLNPALSLVSAPDLNGPLTVSKSLVFGGADPRILAPLSGSPNTSRLMIENSIANQASYLGIRPSGSGAGGALIVYGLNDSPNSDYGILWHDGTQVNIGTGASGAGMPKDLSLWSSGEKWRIPTSGHLHPGVDYTYDLGIFSIRPRDLHIGRDIYLGIGSTHARIRTPLSQATVAQRTLIQSSVPNGLTALGVMPNGTATLSAFTAFNKADDTDNAGYLSVGLDATAAFLETGQLGTGTNVPLSIRTGGATERMRIDTAGMVRVAGKLNVGSAANAIMDGDIATSRNSAPTSGTVYFGNDGGTKYLHYDGSNFSLQGGGLTIGSGIVNIGGGLQVTGSGQPASGAGMEIFTIGALSHLHGYNRSAGTYQSVQLTGLVITLQSMSGGRIVYGSGGSSYDPGWAHNFNGAVITNGRFYQQANGGAYCWDAADFGVSVGVAGSTVVKRDGNGYIWGNYINLTADVQGGAPVYVAGQNGDGYLRWYPKVS